MRDCRKIRSVFCFTITRRNKHGGRVTFASRNGSRSIWKRGITRRASALPVHIRPDKFFCASIRASFHQRAPSIKQIGIAREITYRVNLPSIESLESKGQLSRAGLCSLHSSCPLRLLPLVLAASIVVCIVASQERAKENFSFFRVYPRGWREVRLSSLSQDTFIPLKRQAF